MKKRLLKIISLTLCFSMVSAVVIGCGKKPSAEKFMKIAEEDLDAEVYEIESSKDLTGLDDIGDDELKDGFIISLSGDILDEIYDEAIADLEDEMDGAPFDIEKIVDKFTGEEDFVPSEFVENVSVYAIGNTESEKDAYMVVGLIIEYKDKDKAAEFFDNLEEDINGMGWLSKKLGSGFKADDLSKDEFKNSGSSGYLLLNIDPEAYIDTGLELLEDYGFGKDVISEAKQDLKEFKKVSAALGIYREGNTIVILGGFAMKDDLEEIEIFCDGLGLKNPLDITNSDEMVKAITVTAVPVAAMGVLGMGSYIKKARSAAENIENGKIREEIREYTDEEM